METILRAATHADLMKLYFAMDRKAIFPENSGIDLYEFARIMMYQNFSLVIERGGKILALLWLYDFEFRTARLGWYAFAKCPSLWRAARSAVEEIFLKSDLLELFGHIYKSNPASRRIAEKLGWTLVHENDDVWYFTKKRKGTENG